MNVVKKYNLISLSSCYLMALVAFSMSSSSFALNVRTTGAFNRTLIRAAQYNSVINSISLGNASLNSQAQTLTFPMVLGVPERISIDGFGSSSGLLVNNTSVSGYSVKVDSLNGGQMKGSATALTIQYTLIVDNINQASIPLTSSSTPLTIISGAGAVTDELHPIQISHSALPLNQAADTYNDSITFYLYSN